MKVEQAKEVFVDSPDPNHYEYDSVSFRYNQSTDQSLFQSKWKFNPRFYS